MHEFESILLIVNYIVKQHKGKSLQFAIHLNRHIQYMQTKKILLVSINTLKAGSYDDLEGGSLGWADNICQCLYRVRRKATSI